MPNRPIKVTAGGNNDGAKFLVENWPTTFQTIQIGGDDISFTYDPFEPKAASSNNAVAAHGGNNMTEAPEQVLKINYPKGSYAPSSGPIPGGTQFYADPFGDELQFSKMMISYDVGFPVGFDWVLAGKLPGIYGGAPYDGCSGGAQSTGDECLTMRFMWRKNGLGEVTRKSPFCKNSNVICNEKYGKSIGRGQIYFEPGKWTRLDMVMALNEPAGNTNGTLQVYLNGNLAINMKNIPYRSSGMVGFQGLMFSSFFGGSEPMYATPVDTSIYFRNIQLSVGEPATLYEGTGGSGGGRTVAAGSSMMRATFALALSAATLFL
ncbi:hypothetical protein BGZ58_009954 [Dissophora ornata]|nr:hypothetical protein BGZ58_009954 [Dissophora ornata]